MTPRTETNGPQWQLLQGDALAVLKAQAAESIDCVVTSPPYWGLRDYGVEGQIGLEETPSAYVARLVEVFREARRVLRDDGTLWLNLGDSYASIGHPKSSSGNGTTGLAGGIAQEHSPLRRENNAPGLKHKDLVGIPWRVAFALQADGWYLRSDIIWSKPNPMPESIKDRPTKAHEYLFLLSKSERYHYDADAISETATCAGRVLDYTGDQKNNDTDDVMQATRPKGRKIEVGDRRNRRNRRTVWTVPTEPFPGAHFAVMPTALVRPCVLAGCRTGGTVLDPFAGSGTVGVVALENGCSFVGIDLNPAYIEIARRRLSDTTPALLFLPDVTPVV